MSGSLHESVGGHRLGAFDGESQGAIPHERSQDAESARHAEQDGVVVHFLQSVVLEEDAGVSVNIWPRVLDLAQFGQDWRHNLVDVADELEQRVVGQMLEGELALASVARIGLAEDSVSVSGNDLSGLEGLPDEVLDFVFVGVIPELAAQLLEPHEHFLVGQAVQWSGETVHAGGERQVRIAESRSDEMDSVSADISALVVAGIRNLISLISHATRC